MPVIPSTCDRVTATTRRERTTTGRPLDVGQTSFVRCSFSFKSRGRYLTIFAFHFCATLASFRHSDFYPRRELSCDFPRRALDLTREIALWIERSVLPHYWIVDSLTQISRGLYSDSVGRPVIVCPSSIRRVAHGKFAICEFIFLSLVLFSQSQRCGCAFALVCHYKISQITPRTCVSHAESHSAVK